MHASHVYRHNGREWVGRWYWMAKVKMPQSIFIVLPIYIRRWRDITSPPFGHAHAATASHVNKTATGVEDYIGTRLKRG